MSAKKFIIDQLKALNKPEFDKIVKVYLKEIYNKKRIINTDGKGDVGMDIKIFDFGDEKAQYQLTVQESDSKSKLTALKKKIIEDLDKASLNTKQYGYSNKLFFFYSKELTNQ